MTNLTFSEILQAPFDAAALSTSFGTANILTSGESSQENTKIEMEAMRLTHQYINI